VNSLGALFLVKNIYIFTVLQPYVCEGGAKNLPWSEKNLSVFPDGQGGDIFMMLTTSKGSRLPSDDELYRGAAAAGCMNSPDGPGEFKFG
jgi:hypothetical protein